jgi:hypothetical protein
MGNEQKARPVPALGARRAFFCFFAVYDARIIQRIRALLGKGLKQRAIARKLGVSQGTVSQVFRGKRGDEPAKKAPRLGRIRDKRKCPKHGKVELPCVGCAAEGYRTLHPEIDWSQSDPPPNNDERDRRRTLEQMHFVETVVEKIMLGYE